MKNFTKKEILYWSPSLSKVGTINAVMNSVIGIKKYSNKYNSSIIDACGEWENLKKNKKISFIKLYKKRYFNFLPKGGYFKSRFSYLMIFVFSFLPLLKCIKKRKPEFMIIHLITSLPLIYLIFFKLQTKIILRISGLPKIVFFRKFLWKFISKKIFLVTCPTESTLTYLKKNKIFPKNKLKLLYDPFINPDEIKNKLKEKIIYDKYNKYIISIGRLTRQKNFTLLINSFEVISKYFKNLNLKIIGEGEQRKILEKMIVEKDLTKRVFLLGFKKNIYKYLNQAECFLLSSLWEDPGAVLVEAAALGKNIISSDCDNGPKEILNNGKNGFLFKNNDKKDLIKKFFLFKQSSLKVKKNMIRKLKKKSELYTIKNHSKLLIRYLNEN